MSPHRVRDVGKIIMKESGFGWQWYDVTTAVNNCLSPRHRHNRFALTFSVTRPNGKTKPVSLRKFGRHHSMPFLVLYSNETEAASFEQIDLLTDRLWAKGNSDIKDKGKSSRKNIGSNHKPERRGNDGAEYIVKNSKSPIGNSISSDFKTDEDSTSSMKDVNDISDSSDDNDIDTSNDTDEVIVSKPSEQNRLLALSRERRSIHTNEIPEGPVLTNYKRYHYNSQISKTNPGILKTRKDSKFRQYGKDRGYLSTIYDSDFENRRRRRKKNRSRKHRKGRLRFPKEWDNKIKKKGFPKKEKSVEKDGVCGRKKLKVDFADIGWGDWIISPKSFDAHYCAGSCPFPIMKVSAL